MLCCGALNGMIEVCAGCLEVDREVGHIRGRFLKYVVTYLILDI